ncbi:MAG: nicotinate phosphoribosyltransferase [Sulfitobacter sp.]|nr:nicotinate phosphoribosyltransferase [Sulfitobacter sp.]
MNDGSNEKKGRRRGLLYALIPGGFVLLVLILIASGFWKQETTDDTPDVVEQPVDAQD